jgi:hypothetical protein
MPRRFIRYRAKADKADENQRLVEGVFRELQAKSPADVRYPNLRSLGAVFAIFCWAGRVRSMG